MSVKERQSSTPPPPSGGRKNPQGSPLARLNQAIYRQAPEVWDNLRPAVLGHNIYKSIYRTTAFPKTERERSEAFFNSFLLHIQPAKIEKHALRFTYTFGLGLLSMYLFILLTVSGLLLMFFYVPSTEQAYNRMLDLRSAVSFGGIMRGMHFWSANAMIGVVFFHMCRVFYTGAYKPPREFNWVIGVGLLTVTFLLSFTGYLLPWDQLSLWAVTVGTNIAAATPLLGQKVQYLLIGGPTIGQGALIRFYTLHVVGLPLIASVLMVVHFWRIRKDGNISAPL